MPAANPKLYFLNFLRHGHHHSLTFVRTFVKIFVSPSFHICCHPIAVINSQFTDPHSSQQHEGLQHRMFQLPIGRTYIAGEAWMEEAETNVCLYLIQCPMPYLPLLMNLLAQFFSPFPIQKLFNFDIYWFFTEKTVASVGFEGEHADHLTTTTAQPQNVIMTLGNMKSMPWHIIRHLRLQRKLIRSKWWKCSKTCFSPLMAMSSFDNSQYNQKL